MISAKRLTVMLLMMSFSFVILNFPYLVTWLVFFGTFALNGFADPNVRNEMFAALQISEIFYISSYGAKFFMFCAAGSMSRKMLGSLSNFFFKSNSMKLL